MQDLVKKVSYLKGLAEGFKLDESKDENKLISGILDCLEMVSDELNILQTDFNQLEEYVNMVDDDLSDLEMIFENDDLWDDDDFDDDEDDSYTDYSDDWLDDWDEDQDDDDEDDEF
ncbi:hypothetical protein C7381_10681 [Ezakiella coagulans]|uniref:Uncharacterized protein n=1 Tax=Ezakiella coagulans TaxID=46507 RepID=A0A2U1E2N5_9FIRM|nr:CD1247 N-terminal domain-containing protein [Ezakiella coagulans]KGF07247.1 hypothetical protein HMPREF1634_05360 [Tissierellia bacterium S7-1-4]PVY94208.1 hypothetical protein C7381_10681 [Ezakiella coagulans]UQK60847.1 hypothetical protein M1R54_00630 [Ezakiella coagulans]